MAEKSPLQSKKFVAFLVVEATWKILMGLVLFTVAPGVFQTILMCFLITASGACSIGYILGQAGLDKWIRIAQINADFAQGTLTKLGLPNVSAPSPYRDPDIQIDVEEDEA